VVLFRSLQNPEVGWFAFAEGAYSLETEVNLKENGNLRRVGGSESNKIREGKGKGGAER